jgi:Asp-tRNA(Asn)/Glu-tRNA(Gln) amidotransferase A subunit family amidase
LIFLARPEQVGEGVPVAVKDLFDTAGLVTTYGSAIFAAHVPARTAEAVRRLEDDGDLFAPLLELEQRLPSFG